MSYGYVYYANPQMFQFFIESLSMIDIDFSINSEGNSKQVSFSNYETFINFTAHDNTEGVFMVSMYTDYKDRNFDSLLEIHMLSSGFFNQGEVFSCDALWLCKDDKTLRDFFDLSYKISQKFSLSSTISTDEFGELTNAVSLSFDKREKQKIKVLSFFDLHLAAISLGIRLRGAYCILN